MASDIMTLRTQLAVFTKGHSYIRLFELVGHFFVYPL